MQISIAASSCGTLMACVTNKGVLYIVSFETHHVIKTLKLIDTPWDDMWCTCLDLQLSTRKIMIISEDEDNFEAVDGNGLSETWRFGCSFSSAGSFGYCVVVETPLPYAPHHLYRWRLLIGDKTSATVAVVELSMPLTFQIDEADALKSCIDPAEAAAKVVAIVSSCKIAVTLSY
jgi:hypothetical protein